MTIHIVIKEHVVPGIDGYDETHLLKAFRTEAEAESYVQTLPVGEYLYYHIEPVQLD